jgi:tetratricopeptide (TPR) repeat protein
MGTKMLQTSPLGQRSQKGNSYPSMMYYLFLDKLEFSRQVNETWFSLTSKLAPPQHQKNMRSSHSYREGLIELKANKIQSARNCLAEVKSLLPDFSLAIDRLWGQYRADLLEGEILFHEKKYDQAIAVYEKTREPDFPDVSESGEAIDANLSFNDLKARSLKGKGDRHLINPRHYYRLAKLYEQKGLKDKARERYRKFLSLWKDADPGTPEVEDARRRLALL